MTEDYDPGVLYRYFALDDLTMGERIKPMLTENRLYFPTRRRLNDPFECIVPAFTGAPAKFWNDEAKRLTHGAGLRRRERREAARKLRSRESRQGARREIQADVDKIGVLSLSEVKDDLLMWSHYAAGHKGICLGFLASDNTPFFCDAQRVKYSERRPRFDYRDDKLVQMEKIILTKSTHWSYEKEWRILRYPEGGGRSYEFPAELLLEVIFGCWIESAHKRTVREWIREGRTRPKLYQARELDSAFGLELRQLG